MQLVEGLLAQLPRMLCVGAGISRPVGMAVSLLQFGRLVMPHDGSIMRGELPLLGVEDSLFSCGGPMGGSGGVVQALVGPLDSTIALLKLGGGLDDRLPGGLDHLVGRSDVIPDPLDERPTGPGRLPVGIAFHQWHHQRQPSSAAYLDGSTSMVAFPQLHKRCGIGVRTRAASQPMLEVGAGRG